MLSIPSISIVTRHKTKKMESIQDLLKYDKEHVWHPYTSTINPLPCFLVDSAKGVTIKLETGETLIDGMSSWWAAVHGYNHPELNEAATSQLEKMSHIMFGGLTHRPAINLSKTLIDMTDPKLQHCFLADSGSVAVEISLKMAFQYADHKFANSDKNKCKFMSINYGYHGDTFGAMSVCDPINSMHSLYSGFVRENIFVQGPKCKPTDEWKPECMNDFLAKIEEHQNEVIAVILEPIVQGAGGMRIYHPEFLRGVRAACDKYNVLLILDEIATGFGRTGKLFAYEHAGITPDIICLGKALTGGYLTLSAVLCTEDVAAMVCSGRAGGFMHGPTFMGNPLACNIALKSLEITNRQEWKQQVHNIESVFKELLLPMMELDIVEDVRIIGAIGVVELTHRVDLKWFQDFFVKNGVWVRPFGKLVYLMPPFVISEADLRKLVTVVRDSIENYGRLITDAGNN